MLKHFYDYLGTSPKACAVCLALCIIAVGAIEAHPTFPYNLFPG